jgi:Methyltransferase domain
MPLTDRMREDTRLLRTYLRRSPDDFSWVFHDLGHWEQVTKRWGGKPFSRSRVFEIGFGARPYRLLAMQALGADVYGVDAEAPLLTGSIAEYQTILHTNGWERLVKTMVRHVLFDRRERARFQRALLRRGLTPPVPQPRRFLIGDAAECDPPGRFDVIYSFAVFEHIERSSLERLVPRMADWLDPNGLALITPDVFTGFHGGHLLEWDADILDIAIERRSEPWEHLRQRRYHANTTLNELTRGEYEALFSAHFHILEVIDPPRGRATEFLTPEIRAELSDYTDEDLLDENPLYVLRPRRGQQIGAR